ncbi:DUF3108 domain-containing protein [Archangium violaceum]|uniref:ATP-dependent exodnase (Exonuclease V) alpha subunit-helicase superfamily I member n=1 Tax=Archangium violaceum Cb vi76 TaxID=1406225 RepID=A0A084SP03_9BACT|nr:DUF3108 domain-containing protein [Archangium violaceum]KFA90188.1 hypothetical protein Q664_29900 [Archangium violaceum Cb vi76]
MRMQSKGMFTGMLLSLLLSGAALAQGGPRSAFGPGEQARYRIQYLGMTAGSAQVTVGAPMKQWGKDVWPIVSLARSEAIAGVWPVKDKYVSYWDFGAQRVLGSDMHEDQNNKRRRVRVKLAEDGKSAQVVKQKEGETPRESIHELAEGTLDVAGATFALRNRALEVGQEYAYPVFTGSRTFQMKAKVEARETLDTVLGKQDVFRMRVYTEFSGKLASKRDMVAWFTADARRLPVRIEAELALGSIVAELTEYQQGKIMASVMATARNGT